MQGSPFDLVEFEAVEVWPCWLALMLGAASVALCAKGNCAAPVLKLAGHGDRC